MKKKQRISKSFRIRQKFKSHEDVTSTRLEKYFKTKIKNFSIPSFYFNYRITYGICVSDTSTCVHIDIRKSCVVAIAFVLIVLCCVTCDMVTRMLHVVAFKEPKFILFFVAEKKGRATTKRRRRKDL